MKSFMEESNGDLTPIDWTEREMRTPKPLTVPIKINLPTSPVEHDTWLAYEAEMPSGERIRVYRRG